MKVRVQGARLLDPCNEGFRVEGFWGAPGMASANPRLSPKSLQGYQPLL